MTTMAMGSWWLPSLVLLLLAGFYLYAALRLHRRGDRWPPTRSLSAVLGLALLVAAFMSPWATSMSFPVQVVQHLDMGMAAPLALALSAPVTLALRTLPSRPRQFMLAVLHSRFAQVLTWAPMVLILEVGGMYAYYLTPLFTITERHLWLHILVHLHMFLAGCLLSWYVIARDPMPRRRGTRISLVVLFVAAGCHDLMAKLMYAYVFPPGAATVVDIQLGAQIMFYGGDVIELTLATALLTAWYRRTGRQLTHQRRRQEPAPPTPAALPVGDDSPRH